MYKIVGIKGEALNGGFGKWFLPKGTRPGKWMPKIDGTPMACLNGYHLVEGEGIIDWLPRNGSALLCRAEGRGNHFKDDNKTAFAEARILSVVGILDNVSMRLAAADIAECALPLFEKFRPEDDRPRKSIRAARDFVAGKIKATARDAASDAASAASDAAWAAGAAGAAWAAGAAGDAAWGAVRAAAWVAAHDAVRAAASAAWAAGAAGAVRADAHDAVRVAARDAAWDAAQDAHTKIIIKQAAMRLKGEFR